MSEQDWQQMEADEKAMSETTLKPCPFCGGTDVVLNGYSVECRTCGTMGPDDTRKGRNPSEDWNTRSESDALRRELEEAKAIHRMNCETIERRTAKLAAAQRELGEEQGAHETIAAMCFAHGAESGDGTSKAAVRSIIDQLAAAQKEIGDWKGYLSAWGSTPEIIDRFINGQQERIHAAQDVEKELAAAQKEIERQRARIAALRSGLLLIAGSGCEGEDPEQLCKEFELQMTSFCIPCKAAYFLELDDKPSAIAQAKGAE